MNKLSPLTWQITTADMDMPSAKSNVFVTADFLHENELAGVTQGVEIQLGMGFVLM